MSQGEPRNSAVIGGRYRLEKRLGRGGMGTVWRAEDELLGRAVAVKELHLDGDRETSGALREARTVAQVRHPHVVVVHDVVNHEGSAHIVMELIDGGSLAERLSAGGPLSVEETARTGLALLGALGAAHARGVLHRDVKPANVLMEAGTGRVVLTDFGIAHLAGVTTISETGAFIGSPEYTSPERMRGAAAGPASDLWSLGVLLCAALTGKSPFHRDSLGGVLHAVVHDEIEPPAQAGPLRPVIRGLLERDPERRLGAAEAERLLSAYVATGRIPLYGPAGPEPVDAVPPTVPPAPATAPLPAPAPLPATAPLPAPAPATAAVVPSRAVGPGLRAALSAALVAVAVVATLAVTSLLRGGSQGPAAGTALSPTPASAAPASPHAMTPTPSAPATSSSSRPAAATAKRAPAGYVTMADPEGFGIAVPQGYQRGTDSERVFYVSPDGAFRIGVKTKPAVSGGPLAVMRASDAGGADTNPGYRNASVVPTTHNGLPAALWEFTWNGFTTTEGARHTFDLCWDENGRMYDVWVSAPVGRAAEARGHFDAALDSFTPGG
ncbi:serine/threonine-protein kinase [Streptomyces sp. NPDC046557]|uniref:serine/threonine-protein kinase n=1 Tax=Streptomyces sp. NPDC046557 TaxID=3155372 RepID=UPI0033CF6B89